MSDLGHIDCTESHEKNTFYFGKKSPGLKSLFF